TVVHLSRFGPAPKGVGERGGAPSPTGARRGRKEPRMEAAAPTPPGAITATPLVELACRQPGPFASVYLATEAAIDNASQRSQARWKSFRDRLEDAGVPQAPLRAIDQLVPDAHRRGNSLGAIANSK